MKPVILILYTTLYRGAGDQFARAALTLKKEKLISHAECEVVCQNVESKLEFKEIISNLASAKKQIYELHFIGHSGVYGIMFGSTRWPEQFSPYEWTQIKIPFAAEAKAYFHACRTSRWFAPFFARTFSVQAFGYFWYTTVSLQKNKFVWEARANAKASCYIISVPGKKSHGILASLGKYLRLMRPYPMQSFAKDHDTPDASYDAVSHPYAQTFADIKRRRDEWNWLKTQLADLKPKTALDIGCGNGALLRELASVIEQGFGVDASLNMIHEAKAHPLANVQFQCISGPFLPFADAQMDVVISLLSFRYLDWDPMLQEMLRVLKPHGEILIVDMVAMPLRFYEWPRFVLCKLKQLWQQWREIEFARQLKTLVKSQAWQEMLKHNPMRAQHEYVWYLQSRFPKGKIATINLGWQARILAFRSGPVMCKTVAPQMYP